MTTFSSYFAHDVDEETIPLKGDAYVPAEPDAEDAPLRPWAVIALLWYIVFASIFGGYIITLLSSPPLPALWPPAWPECAIGTSGGLLLLAWTAFFRRMARWEATR